MTTARLPRVKGIGCALLVLSVAASCAVYFGVKQARESALRRRLEGMRTVLAVISDKGISPVEHRDRISGRPDSARLENERWIRFECQIGGAVREGTRLSLFVLPPHEERNLWDSFEKGAQCEAHYDPHRDECILSVYEPADVGTSANMFKLLVCAVVAAVALHSIFEARS